MSSEFKKYLECPPEELRVLLAGKDVNNIKQISRDNYWDDTFDNPDADDSFRDYVYDQYLDGGTTDEEWDEAYDRASGDLSTVTSLFVATVQSGDVERARVLIELGANLLDCDSVVAEGSYAREGGTIWPVLNVAVLLRDVEMVKLLLDAGADPNFTGKVKHPFFSSKEVLVETTAGRAWAWTCTEFYGNDNSITPRDLTVLELLAGAGAHLGDALTTIVQQMCSSDLAKVLALGVDPNSEDSDGWTPLKYADRGIRMLDEDDHLVFEWYYDPESVPAMAELLRKHGATS